MTIDDFLRLSEADKCRAVAVAMAQDLGDKLLISSGMLARVEVDTPITWERSRDFHRIAWMIVDECRH